jgi:hypothetical protein
MGKKKQSSVGIWSNCFDSDEASDPAGMRLLDTLRLTRGRRFEAMANICKSYFQRNPPEHSSSLRFEHPQNSLVRFPYRAVALTLFLVLCAISPSHAQSHDVICIEGAGDFEAEFRTGVKVHVGAARSGELATRVCEAVLSSNKQNLVVATGAAKVDIDAFGVDLGVGVPVVAFQVKKSTAECCMAYKIYSLRTPPALLHTITGGEFFSAADTDLDGRVEIWTDDAASVAGFDNLLLGDLDFAPPIVLRFVRSRLLDVSSEFQPYYDRKIAEERAKLDSGDLSDFKRSDGRLALAAGMSVGQLIHLRSAKVKVLEIVWSYLYSGREEEAWRSLADMWPASDFDRIRAALLSARARGIRSQVEGVSKAASAGREQRAKIFDATTLQVATPGVTPKDVTPKMEITTPKPILMERPPPLTAFELGLARSESQLELVIDSAGKVRSAEILGDAQKADAGLIGSTSSWKFIPAFSADRPVASRIFLGVSLKR